MSDDEMVAYLRRLATLTTDRNECEKLNQCAERLFVCTAVLKFLKGEK